MVPRSAGQSLQTEAGDGLLTQPVFAFCILVTQAARA